MRVDTQLLDEKIANSGLKVSHIVNELGISPAAFYKKKNGTIPFRVAEVYVICDLLNITDNAEREKIFFPQ